MVGEFPDLQGIVGREYAIKAGEDERVAQAIGTQYLPKGPEDDIPTSRVGACLGLAERLDALVGLFGVGNVPSSTSDPYGLRRAAIGIVRVIEGHHIEMPLSELFALAVQAYADQGKDEIFERTTQEVIEGLVEFVSTRQRHQLTESFATDVVDAVLAVGSDETLSVRDRVEALSSLRDEDDFGPLAVGFKRVVNILKKQDDQHVKIPTTIDPDHFEHHEERVLFESAKKARQEVDTSLTTRDWAGAMRALIALKGPIDTFFDEGPMVMTEEESLRLNRLAMLDTIRRIFLDVADISRIQTGSD